MAYLQLNYHVSETRYGEIVKPIENEEWFLHCWNITKRMALVG